MNYFIERFAAAYRAEMADFAAMLETGAAPLAGIRDGLEAQRIGAVAGRRLWHEAPPTALAHPGVSAAPEIHGEGIGLAGPSADRLRLLMRERRVADIPEFIALMGRTFPAAPAPSAPGPWTAVLETAAKGTHGGLLVSLIPDTVNPARSGTAPTLRTPASSSASTRCLRGCRAAHGGRDRRQRKLR